MYDKISSIKKETSESIDYLENLIEKAEKKARSFTGLTEIKEDNLILKIDNYFYENKGPFLECTKIKNKGTWEIYNDSPIYFKKLDFFFNENNKKIYSLNFKTNDPLRKRKCLDQRAEIAFIDNCFYIGIKNLAEIKFEDYFQTLYIPENEEV